MPVPVERGRRTEHECVRSPLGHRRGELSRQGSVGADEADADANSFGFRLIWIFLQSYDDGDSVYRFHLYITYLRQRCTNNRAD